MKGELEGHEDLLMKVECKREWQPYRWVSRLESNGPLTIQALVERWDAPSTGGDMKSVACQ